MKTNEQKELTKRLFSALPKEGHLPVLTLCTGLEPFAGKRGRAGFQGVHSPSASSCLTVVLLP